MKSAPDLWLLYAQMLKSRLFEEIVTQFWEDGLISGEMHLGTGEEAIVAGILAHLQDGDAMALDHRGTPPLIMRGMDPVKILLELLGHSDGLCVGQGGHMHLFSKEYLAASSGIVGAVGPTAAGFALAAKYLRPNSLVVAFFGEGSVNQGMMMESMNLTAAWDLPVLFVCKDDNWSITTPSDKATGGSLSNRARSLGLTTFETDGRDVVQVWETAKVAVAITREGKPAFLHAKCVHLEGHFLGYQLLRITRAPLKELPRFVLPLSQAFLRRRGAPIKERLAGLRMILAAIMDTVRDPREKPKNDPIFQTRRNLESNPTQLNELEIAIEEEIRTIVATTIQVMQS